MRKICFFLAVFALAGSLWAADPRVGTWKLNAAKSKFPADAQTFMKNATIAIRELDADQLEFITTGIRQDGSPVSEKSLEPKQGGVVTWIEPSQPQGRSFVHTVIGPGDFHSTVLQDGKQFAVFHWVVGKDLKTMFVTIKRTDAQGKPAEGLLLFDRQ
jgi:hypothetical protein